MTAADAREELEMAIWRRVRDSAGRPVGLDCERMDEILIAADRYADAVADDWLAKHVHDTIAGRERLADLDAAVRDAS